MPPEPEARAKAIAARQAQSGGLGREELMETCFMCELYCPADALYVSPLAEHRADVDENALAESGQLGSYAREMGWKAAKPRGADKDPTFRFRVLQRGG